MKILHSLVFFLPTKIGGIENYVKQLALEQLTSGNDVKIVIPIWPNWPVTSDYIFEGIQVRTYLEKSNITPKQFQGAVPSPNLARFQKIIHEEKPDIVHFHQLNSSNGTSIFHLEVAKKAGAKIVFTAHLAGTTCYTSELLYKQKEVCNGEITIKKCTSCVLNKKGLKNTFLLNLLVELNYRITGKNWNVYHLTGGRSTYLSISELILLKKERLDKLFEISDAVIVLSEWYKEVMLKNKVVENKLYLIKQGFGGVIKNVDEPLTYNGQEPLKVMFIGRISPEKGLHILISAIKELPHTKVILNIYGQHDNDDYYNSLRLASNKSSNVFWCGILEPAMVLSTMQQHDLLCIPSTLAEMAPLVLSEAKAVKLPVIGTNIGGIKDEIENDITGWLFPINDNFQLMTLINNIIINPRLLEIIKSNIPPPRSFNDISKEVEKIYLNIMSPITNEVH